MTEIRWCITHDQGYWAIMHDFTLGSCEVVTMPDVLAVAGRVKFKKWLFTLKRFAAVTYPPAGVYVRQSWWDDASLKQQERLLWHEGVHWRQYAEKGLLVYVFYVGLWFRYGYKNHPYEIEAFNEATEFRP